MNTLEGSVYHGLHLLTLCGGGAYGEVYYCRDISGRFLAVKIISKKKLGTDWERELKGVRNYRCITENNPLLLQIYHVEEDEDSFFYTMEPADNAAGESSGAYLPDTLSRRLKCGPLRDDEIFDILSGIFNAVKIIHAAGFAHRDIKPDNIIFVNGRPKLGDIGLMSSLAATVTNPAGTLYFFPPEQRNENFKYDRESRQKSDLYAFGKVIYCAITANDPRNFPSWPGDLTLSAPRKYFLHLACRLCHIEPACRPENICDIESEIIQIRRCLRSGETAGDRLRLFLEDLRTQLLLWRKSFSGGVRNHYFLLSGALLFFGGIFYYALRYLFLHSEHTVSPPPSGLMREAERLRKSAPPLPDNHFRCLHGRASFEVPQGWTLRIRSDIVEMNRKKAKNETELNTTLKTIRHLQNVVIPGGDAGALMQISIVPFTGKELEAVPDAELADFLRREVYGEGIRVLTCRRLNRDLMGKAILFFGKTGSQTHWDSFIFLMQDACISLTLLYQSDVTPHSVISDFYGMVDSFERHEERPAVYAADPDGRTPFMLAVEAHDFTAAEQMLRDGADIAAAAFGGSNALHLAALDNAPETVRFLLEHGADVNAPDPSASDATALFFAADGNSSGVLRELLKHHADLEKRNKLDKTALVVAVENSCRDSVRLLLEAGADPNVIVRQAEGLSLPLSIIAVVRKDPEILRMLIRGGMDVQTLNSSGENALLRLLNSVLVDREPEKLEFADILIDAGIDVLRQDHEGRTALMYAAGIGSEKLVRRLLAAGARKEIRDKKGNCAADYCKNPEIRKILMPAL